MTKTQDAVNHHHSIVIYMLISQYVKTDPVWYEVHSWFWLHLHNCISAGQSGFLISTSLQLHRTMNCIVEIDNVIFYNLVKNKMKFNIEQIN